MRVPLLGPRLLDTGNPVADHPLNDGEVAWWVPTANVYGGGELIDLHRYSNGVLTNGPTWGVNPYGYGSVVFDGTDDYSLHAVPVATSSTFTFVFAGRATVTAGGFQTLFSCDTGSNNGFRIGGITSVNTPNLTFGGVAEYDLGGSIFLNNWAGGTWSFIVVSCTGDGGTARLWHKRSDQNWDVPTGVTVGTMSGTPSRTTIARSPNGDYCNMEVWSLHVMNFACADQQVYAWYDQFIRNFPAKMRRFTPSVWNALPPPAASTAFTKIAGTGGLAGVGGTIVGPGGLAG